MKNSLIILLFSVFFSAFGFSQTDTLKIVDKKVPFGMKVVSGRNIDAVIVHSTFNNSGGNFYDLEKIIGQFRRYGVSAHYIIDRNGVIYRLVDEQNISFHAGKCVFPDGSSNGNMRSIGIELMTSFTESPTEMQMRSLLLLVSNIQQREKIKYVLRHSDIAPERKTDPWNFNWEEFLKELGKRK
jgi:N-acetyl-anhydromuramyl-L-alanine amidase AmpD